MPVPPAASISSAVSSSVSGRAIGEGLPRTLRPVAYSAAPAAPSSTAIPRPAPRVAPATTQTAPLSGRSASVPAKDAQQEEEQVERVEIQADGAHQRAAPAGVPGHRLLLHVLRVVRGQAHEDRDAGVCDHPPPRAAGGERVPEAGKDSPDEGDQQ